LHIRQVEKDRDPSLYCLSENPTGRRELQQMSKISENKENFLSRPTEINIERPPKLVIAKAYTTRVPISLVKKCWLRWLPDKAGIVVCEMLELEDCYHLVSVLFFRRRNTPNVSSICA